MRRTITVSLTILWLWLPTALGQTDPRPSQPASDSPVESPAVAAAAAAAGASAVDPAVLAAESERIAAIERVKDTVLAIFATSGQGGGSGVVISADGFALTNFHVARPCGDAMKCGMADGQLYDAVIVGVDPTGDVALIKLFGRDDFPHAELGDSDRVKTGDWCFAMGNPFMLATDFQPTVTYGIVSGVHRYQYPAGTLLEYADCIQTDASINPGNSGGPLFDAAGRLAGINGRGSFEKRGRVNVGVAYAVSINQIKNFLGCLYAGRIVDHATLGAQVGTDHQRRVVVTNILETSDAYRRGLRYDDEIVSFGGRPITTPNGFKNALGIFPKGWRVPLSFRREGNRYDVLVRLSGVHGEEELIRKTEGRPPTPPMPLPEEKKPKDADGPKDGDQQPEDAQRREKDETLPPSEGKPRPQRLPIPIPIPIRPGEPPPMGTLPGQPPMPEICKEHFEARRGFANYYFNKLHRDRVWKAWNARADFQGRGETWAFSGHLEGGGAFGLDLSDTEAVLRLPSSDLKWLAGEELGASLDPPQSGGLFAALHLWRRLAVAGPADFGAVTYLGTFPLPGHPGLVDVLAAVHKDVQCRFLFNSQDGRLLALEFLPEADVDPCEVYFSEYHDVEGRLVPGRMEVRIGDDPFATFKLDEFRMDASAEGIPPAPPDPPADQDRTVLSLLWTAAMLTAATRSEAASIAETITSTEPKIVKVYGAGGFRGMEAYQSGMLISPEGHILTVFSYVLDTEDIAVTLDDGRRFPARLLGADPRLEVAVLKIEAENLPCFNLDAAIDVQAGTQVLAFSNLFGVAMGDEPASVQHGVVSVETTLEARRGVFETPYHGPVYVLDAMTNNPGAAGGALVTWRGDLVAMLGKELRNALSNTWLNYAMPIRELRPSVDAIRSDTFVPASADGQRPKPDRPLTLDLLGIVLVPDVLERTPPYVDQVRAGSAAEAADVCPDDLVLLLGDRLIQSCRALRDELQYVDFEDEITLSVLRGQEVLQRKLQVRSENPEVSP